MTLENPVVRLRLLDQRDEALYLYAYTDEEMMRLVGKPLVRERAQVAFRQSCALNLEQNLRARTWVITLRDSGKTAGLLGIRRSGRIVEIGGMILPDWQGRGVSGHAFPLGMEAAFSCADVDEMMIRFDKSNTFAAGLMHKIGFAQVTAAHPDDGLERWRLRRDEWVCWQARRPRGAGMPLAITKEIS